MTTPAFAWGDEGHEVAALIAKHYLDPAVATKVNTLLASDTTQLTTTTNIDSEATWADHYRAKNTANYNQTHNWHFVDLQISGPPDLKAACFGEPPLNGATAFNGPPNDCVVDKINEFVAELRDPATNPQERLFALQFILHFVGDLHQPLHSSDANDRGGNDKKVRAVPALPKSAGKSSGELHGFWDTQFVAVQGKSATTVANKLIKKITAAKRRQWSAGTANDWAIETYSVSKVNIYGPLPAAGANGIYTLPAPYVKNAKSVVADQLSKAGVRLAFVLNDALK
ncbi:MAG: S1/P1 nuclease [Proteobacteria bacterium]|nr:S1/P1 nuclease [Pseudomonadota bacterium]